MDTACPQRHPHDALEIPVDVEGLGNSPGMLMHTHREPTLRTLTRDPDIDPGEVVHTGVTDGRRLLIEAGPRRRAALLAAGEAALALGCRVRGFVPSGLPGPKGNRETFMWLGDPAAGGAGADSAQELEPLARKAEP